MAPRTVPADPGIQRRLRSALGHMARIKGASLRDLARSLGISNTSLHALLSGKTKRPSANTLRALSEKFGVRPEWVLDGSGPEFADAPQRKFEMGGISFFTWNGERLFAASLEGWRRILNYEMASGRRHAGEENAWYALAWEARLWTDTAYELKSIPLDFDISAKPARFLLGLLTEDHFLSAFARDSPGSPICYLTIRNESQEWGKLVGGRNYILIVEQLYDRDLRPIDVYGSPSRHGLAVFKKEHAAMRQGPYPKA